MERSIFANASTFASVPRVYVNMLTDFGFKRIFGDEVLLRAFLNALFEKEGKVIESLEYLDTEMIPEFEDERLIAYDVHCRTDKGEEFIVEMQRCQQSTYGERCLYYMSRAVVRQGMKGSAFHYRMKPVYGIFLTDFQTRGLTEGRMVSQVALREDGTERMFSDRFRMFFINLKAFKKGDEECESTLEKWIYNIKFMGTRTAMPEMAKDSQVFNRLYSLAELAAMSDADRARYEYALKLQWDKNMDDYTRKVEKEEARAEGRAEERAANAKALKQKGVSVAVIADALGLSLEFVESL